MFHSRAYKRVSRRNNFTVAYHKGETIGYGQMEEFFIVEDEPGLVCGAVIALMPIDGSCISKNNQVLGARRQVQNTGHRSQITVLPIQKVSQTPLKANLRPN